MAERGKLDRRALCRAVLAERGDLLVVAGLGAPAWDVTAVGDRPENLPLWGGMGGAAMIGLGLAIAQPRRSVLVITGDGEMLMGLGALATIAAARAPNLAIAVLDNARYGETGSQRSHTGLTTDLATVAAGCGWRATAAAHSMPEVAALRPRLRSEPLFAVIGISAEERPRHLPPRDGAYLARRFRATLGIAPG